MPDRREATPLRMALTFAGVVVAAALGMWALVQGVGALSGAPPVPAPVPTRIPIASVPATPSSEDTTPTSLATPTVELTTPIVATPTPTSTPTPKPKPVASKYVVVIDPGHQGQGDSSQEPIGPGASATKPKVASGTEGVATHNPESLINLDVSLKLRDDLAAQGVTVVMVRTSQNVNISNSARAIIANKAKADLFVRVHCDGINSSSTHGFSMQVPDPNGQWTKPIAAASHIAAVDMENAVAASTGAADRGIVNRGDFTGFNYCKVTSILIEMGFMSNPAEDRRLATFAYQRKLASGMTTGILTYLHRLHK